MMSIRSAGAGMAGIRYALLSNFLYLRRAQPVRWAFLRLGLGGVGPLGFLLRSAAAGLEPCIEIGRAVVRASADEVIGRASACLSQLGERSPRQAKLLRGWVRGAQLVDYAMTPLVYFTRFVQ